MWHDICSCLLLCSCTLGPFSVELPCGCSHDARDISQLTWKKELPARAPAGGRLWGWALSMLRSMLCSCTGTCAAEPMTPGKLRFSQEGRSACTTSARKTMHGHRPRQTSRGLCEDVLGAIWGPFAGNSKGHAEEMPGG